MTTAELAIAARNGDVEAFTQLVERYQAMAFGYALVTLRDYHLAEDATQMACLTAFRLLDTLRDPARFGGWLRGIVRFECLHIQRERRRQPSIHLDEHASLATGQPGPEDRALMSFTAEDVRRLLAQLPERQRIVASLYYLQDQSQGGIADFLGLPVSTVNNRLRESRQFLRRHGAHLMTDPATQSPDFATAIGQVLRHDGLAIDARLSGDLRPDLLTAVRIPTASRTVSAYISQYLDDDVARLIVPSDVGTSVLVPPGTTIHNSGIVVTRPLGESDIMRIVTGASGGEESRQIPTGIKTIDLFAPLVDGGTVAIVGDRNVGKMVLVDELLYRLATSGHHLSILVFLRTPDETGLTHLLEGRSVGPVTVVAIPVADASPTALASALDRVDTVLVMSRELGRERFYPAIDPGASRSLLQQDDTIRAARKLLTQGPANDPRGSNLRAYLTQPFYVAEPYTNRPGITVSPEVTRTDLNVLLTDDPGAWVPEDLMMQGSLADVSSTR
jgi:RNA polymerase sigma-70 factor (ECF subfamily)